MTAQRHASRSPRTSTRPKVGARAEQGRLTLVSDAPATATPARQLLIDGRLGDDFGPVATSAHELPAPGPWCARLALALAEVIDGRRPASQLVRWIDYPVALGLREEVSAPALRTRGTGRRLAPMVLKSLRWSAPADGVLEAAAIVVGAARPIVLTLRIEGRDGRWLCVEVGSPDGWSIGDTDPWGGGTPMASAA